MSLIEGFLWKRGEGITGLRWKRRWFSLFDDKLNYYANKGEAPLGMIDLTSSKKLTIRADDQTQLDEWVSALNRYSTQRNNGHFDSSLVHENLFTELSDDERINLKRLFQYPFHMHASGFIRLFTFLDIPDSTTEFQWNETHTIGALVLVEQTLSKQFSFRVLDPESSAVSWVCPVDLSTTNYEEETEYFHSFDGNKDDVEELKDVTEQQRREADYRIGFSFSSIVESQMMFDKVTELKNRSREEVAVPERQNSDGLMQQITPTVRRYLKIFQKNIDEEEEVEPQESEISTIIPGTFQHVSHVGVNARGRIETRGQLPSQWISQNERWHKFFLESGLQPAELKDEEIARDLIESTTQFLIHLQPTVPEKETTDQMRLSRRSQYLTGNSAETLQAALNSKSSPRSSYATKSFSFNQVPNTMPKMKPNQENELKGKIESFITERRKRESLQKPLQD
ncbi:hypothetical protein PROFUN_06333 [Planoprotostelium fungivorum]|uniref:PH domain-containing protein n=1 Tax=Planoprotostelium fungivorum TaxID=1890364 RepID=A0A2P6NP56_9EUKA|nr:hypothetical protein PROFUN_06333 [Planoprotostelium fungivorum]